ncbi:hypothetical protein AVEN_258531-1, partial [Araneus ventricosus]
MKNVEGTSRRTESSKGEAYKRILSCEETSLVELVNADQSLIQHDQLYSRATGNWWRKKVEIKQLGNLNGREEAIIFQTTEKLQFSTKNVEGTSRRTKSSKGKANKRILSCEEISSDELGH